MQLHFEMPMGLQVLGLLPKCLGTSTLLPFPAWDPAGAAAGPEEAPPAAADAGAALIFSGLSGLLNLSP